MKGVLGRKNGVSYTDKKKNPFMCIYLDLVDKNRVKLVKIDLVVSFPALCTDRQIFCEHNFFDPGEPKSIFFNIKFFFTITYFFYRYFYSKREERKSKVY